MAVFHRRPRHALCLLLLFGILLSYVDTALVMKTSSRSESEVFLPDGQVVRLLFWVEDTGGETLQQTAKMVERDDLATEEDETVKKKNTNKNKNKKRKGRDASEEKNHDKSSTISITYSVSGLQYQSISFNASEHNVWLSALFNYNRVEIPAASLSFNPAPPSWWERRVQVSSEPPVYWYLCPSPDQCAPGKPPHLLHSANPHPILVTVLGTTSALLLVLCLGLVALVLHLWKKPRPTQSRHWL